VRRCFVVVFVLAAVGRGGLSGFEPAQENRRLAPETLNRALNDFKQALDERWSYRHANLADFDAAIARLRIDAGAGMSLDEFGLELHKILALGIDGHSRVAGYQLPGTRYLPFLIEPVGQRFIAFNPARTAFLADGFPYVVKIDGRDVPEWCDAAAVIVPKGSPQYIRHRCLGLVRNLDFVRGLMKIPQRDSVDVELLSSDGRSRLTLTLGTADVMPLSGVWPRGGSRLLENGVGYLRLPYMDKTSSEAEIRQWMPKLRNTIGLIVDVRDNDGGARDAVRLLYSYVAAPADPPKVVTTAAYRLHPSHNADHLAPGHFMYPLGASQWTAAERQAIARFAKTFTPAWRLPAGQFSDWHYMVLRRLNDPDTYDYVQPVVVLMNAKCFSATDNFLAGLKGVPNVTLLGTPSSGGSSAAVEIPLGSTPLQLRIGTIASFQIDGQLFDGRGVPPDIVVEPAPEYYIGGVDNVLAEAVRRVSQK
jgi:Peptidase family S41